MNQVYLSGVVAREPKLLSVNHEGTKQAIIDVRITFKSSFNLVQSAVYRVNTWGGLADWALKRLATGQHIMLRGYLTQYKGKVVGRDGITYSTMLTSITAKEIMPGVSNANAAPENINTTLPIGGEEIKE